MPCAPQPGEKRGPRRFGFWERKEKGWIWVFTKNREGMKGMKNLKVFTFLHSSHHIVHKGHIALTAQKICAISSNFTRVPRSETQKKGTTKGTKGIKGF
jgi:hypothetical protein